MILTKSTNQNESYSRSIATNVSPNLFFWKQSHSPHNHLHLPSSSSSRKFNVMNVAPSKQYFWFKIFSILQFFKLFHDTYKINNLKRIISTIESNKHICIKDNSLLISSSQNNLVLPITIFIFHLALLENSTSPVREQFHRTNERSRTPSLPLNPRFAKFSQLERRASASTTRSSCRKYGNRSFHHKYRFRFW